MFPGFLRMMSMSFSSLSIISVSCVSDVWICKYRGSRRALKILPFVKSKCTKKQKYFL